MVKNRTPKATEFMAVGLGSTNSPSESLGMITSETIFYCTSFSLDSALEPDRDTSPVTVVGSDCVLCPRGWAPSSHSAAPELMLQLYLPFHHLSDKQVLGLQ